MYRYQIINWFPIGYPFRVCLRAPTNPGRTNLPQVPLGFRGERFSLSSRYSCLHSLLRFVQQPSQYYLLPTTQCSPTNNTLRYCSGTSEGDFSPLTSSARKASTGELLRTLSMMAASKPTSQLSQTPHFLLHLVTSLGPLLPVWAVPLSTMNLIAHSLSPTL